MIYIHKPSQTLMEEYFGKYERDGFLIRIPENQTVINPKTLTLNTKNKEAFGLFLHEYWHSLLHLSTFFRVKEFIMFQDKISIFSKTLTEEGTSRGTRDMKEEDRETLQKSYDFKIVASNNPFNSTTKFDSIRVSSEPTIIQDKINNSFGRISALEIPVNLYNNEVLIESTVYTLDVLSIEESIADAIETMVNKDSNNTDIIYRILNELLAFYGLDNHDNHLVASLGTLSLLTTDPPYSIKNLILRFKDLLVSGCSKYEALEIIKDEIRSLIRLNIDTFKSDLKYIEDTYLNREPLYSSLKYVIDKINKLFIERLKNPTFDTDCFISGEISCFEFEYLIGKVHKTPLLLQKGKNEQDLLITMDGCQITGTDNLTYNVGEFYKILSSMEHFFTVHYSGNDDIRRSEGIETEEPCPFVNSCEYNKLQEEKKDICKTNPWVLVSKEKNICEYGKMTACLIGHTRKKL